MCKGRVVVCPLPFCITNGYRNSIRFPVILSILLSLANQVCTVPCFLVYAVRITYLLPRLFLPINDARPAPWTAPLPERPHSRLPINDPTHGFPSTTPRIPINDPTHGFLSTTPLTASHQRPHSRLPINDPTHGFPSKNNTTPQ
jgi:hypothetical protein